MAHWFHYTSSPGIVYGSLTDTYWTDENTRAAQTAPVQNNTRLQNTVQFVSVYASFYLIIVTNTKTTLGTNKI